MRKLVLALSSAITAAALAGCGELAPQEAEEEISSSSAPVVGGAPANPTQWSWIVSLRSSSGSHFCGGSLIAPDWVLTAAHCPTPATVRVGPNSSTAISRGVSRRITHPGYNASTSENDLALLQLSQPVTGVQTALLNRDPAFPSSIPLSQSTSSTQANIRVAGWGATSEGGGTSSVLMAAAIPAITNASCQAAYVNETIFTSNLCAGYQGGGVDTCQGDSGGPLTLPFSGPVLAGITSWGYGCARPGLPGVYGRISSHLSWITQHAPAATTFSPTAAIMAAISG